MDTNTIKENYNEVISHFKSKLKLPIILTYSVILIIYNWDIIFYLLYQKGHAIDKINYIKNIENTWYHRILLPILISIFYALLFPILQVGINYLFRWFKNKNNELERDEELKNAGHRFEVQTKISGSQSLEVLNNQITNLSKDKEHLNEQITTLIREKEELIRSSNAISSKLSQSNNDPKSKLIQDKAKELLDDYNDFSDEEKVAFQEIINFFNQNSVLSEIMNIEDITTFPIAAESILNFLLANNIINEMMGKRVYTREYKVSKYGKEIISYILSNSLIN